jgi:nicotinamide phosphoribosyltransferase
MDFNLILDTDSYKASHWLQYPPETEAMYSYFESRGGRYGQTVFFGLQWFMREYLSKPITAADVNEAAEFFAAHGEPFNREGWMKVVTKHNGYLPVRIRAVPEGLVVPTRNILLSVESTDPELFWVVSWLETQMVRLWYPITVATQSHNIRRIIWEALVESADDPAAEIDFKLHDFGGRGVTSREAAGIGGMAHLVNFMGSDTVEGVRYANHFYDCEMAGFSIPAAEHSTMTMWGKAHEADAYRNMVKQYAGEGKLYACVSDSWDIFSAVENLWGEELRELVKESGGTLIIRPDSGNPPDVVLKCLQILERKVGMTKNTKGYKVLPPEFRLIQGDGVNEDSIQEILRVVLSNGYSASNIAFGCGGALLQKMDRDTQKFAFKCSWARVAGKDVEVFKDPATDHGKVSKKGRMSLVREGGQLRTVPEVKHGDLLEVVYENGKILRTLTFDDVRKRAKETA